MKSLKKKAQKKKTTTNNKKHLSVKNNNTKIAFAIEMYEEMKKKKLSNIEHKCINIYKANTKYHDYINKFLWESSDVIDSNIKYVAQMLLKIIIEKGIFFDHEIIVYRNFNFATQTPINNIKSLKNSEEKNFKGLLSTTYNPNIFLKYNVCKENEGRIIIPANTPFIYISGGLEEDELLFLPGILVKTASDYCLGTFKYRINVEHIQKILDKKI